MKTIYLHIGFGKSGSSALQAYLSCNALHKDGAQSLAYCCLREDGMVLSGAALEAAASKHALRYLTSISDVSLISNIGRTKKDLDRVLAAGRTAIFSQEDWGRRASGFVDPPFLSQLGCEARIIVYVRPQIEWFNSGWWQWWAWHPEHAKPVDVLNQWGFGFMRWAEMIDRWSSVPGVIDVTVRLHPKDIVQDFLQLFGDFSPKEFTRVNVSLSPTIIKLLLRFPSLRQPHDAYVDAILADIFDMYGASPWIVDKSLATRIVEATHDDNIALMEYLDASSKSEMAADRRWWDVDHFSDRYVWTEKDLTLELCEYEALMEKALPQLLSLARQSNQRV